jgi:hypothetical protein
VDLIERHDDARGTRVGAGPGGDWAVVGDWALAASIAGTRISASSRDRLAGEPRIAGGRVWAGLAAYDLGSGAWAPLPPLPSSRTLRDAAWLDAGRIVASLGRTPPPRRQGPGGEWSPSERTVVLDAESREELAVLLDGLEVDRLAAAAGTVVAGADGVLAWREASGEPQRLADLPQIDALALRADGLVVAAAAYGRDVLLCSPEGDFRRELAGTAGATALAMHPSDALVAIGRGDGVELRTLEGELRGSAPAGAQIVDLAFSEDGTRLLVLEAGGLTIRDSA